MADRRSEHGYDGPSDALKTYRYLRLGIIAAVVLLETSLVLELRRSDVWLGSISAYYYTPVRSVFVGCMMMVGLSLIVIKGRGAEDLLLNVAGMLAPVVALVPTGASKECSLVVEDAGSVAARRLAYPAPGPCDATSVLRAPTNIDNNIRSLLFAGLLCLFAGAFLALVNALRSDRGVRAHIEQVEPGTKRSLAVMLLLLLAGLAWYVIDRRGFDAYAHFAAAGTMFLFLFFAVVSKVLEHRRAQRRPFVQWYSAVGVLMVLGAAAFAHDRISRDHHVFLLEAWEITSFAGFWILQTWENWWEEPS